MRNLFIFVEFRFKAKHVISKSQITFKLHLEIIRTNILSKTKLYSSMNNTEKRVSLYSLINMLTFLANYIFVWSVLLAHFINSGYHTWVKLVKTVVLMRKCVSIPHSYLWHSIVAPHQPGKYLISNKTVQISKDAKTLMCLQYKLGLINLLSHMDWRGMWCGLKSKGIPRSSGGNN
jgi:hypothetical protein